jgi:hypothetical protein
MTTLKTILLILCFVSFIGFPTAAQASPPKTVTAEFNIASQTLTVTIDHPSLSYRFHHIGIVEISLNGKPFQVARYGTQPADTFSYTYTIEAKPGDALDITVRCNLSGFKTISFTVPNP